MVLRRIDLPRSPGRPERHVDASGHCHESLPRSRRPGEWNSDGIQVEFRWNFIFPASYIYGSHANEIQNRSHMPRIESMAVWRCERRLPRPQPEMSHFRTDFQPGGPVCFARPQAVLFLPGSDLHRVLYGNSTKPDLGNSSGNATFCDRSRSTSEAVERAWCLRDPRAARGLTDAYHPSKRGRCGDASGRRGGCRPKGRISVRISSLVVLFAFQDLTYR